MKEILVRPETEFIVDFCIIFFGAFTILKAIADLPMINPAIGAPASATSGLLLVKNYINILKNTSNIN